MKLTESERAKKFADYWSKNHFDYKEKGNVGRFWIDLLGHVYGVSNASEYIKREMSVPNMDNHTDFIDVYIPRTKVIIEQKAPKYKLDQPELRKSLGGMVTPFQQAWKYNSDLPYSQRARWIVTCNFKEFWIYDMNQSGTHPKPTKVKLSDLEHYYYQLDFLIDPTRQDVKQEYNVSSQACDIIDEIYHKLLDQYSNPKDPKVLKNVNKLCVRLVFCLYADDSGIFGKHDMFRDYMKPIPAFLWRNSLIQLFKVLNEKEDERDSQLNDKLAQFPYVNGGMFADKPNERMQMPGFTKEIKDLIINKASQGFDWSKISPTIFGSLFEITLNPKERHNNGMFYTSVENIHKVIDPLFLNNLRHELNTIKTRYKTHDAIRRHALAFQDKLASLTFFDPACGSGNFLTETYLCLRRLENQAIELMFSKNGRIQNGLYLGHQLIRVSIHQFYGIEINDFAVSVAKTAMWIAESQMVRKTRDIIQQHITFLPLKTNRNIKEADALTTPWDEIVDPTKLDYIISNPPFVGQFKDKEQRKDMKKVLKGFKDVGKMDFVSAWYKKSADMMAKNPKLRTALVSTNSITKGEQVSLLWKPLIFDYKMHINFAYKPFKWANNAKNDALVYCVIISFSRYNNHDKLIYYRDGQVKRVNNINPYLHDLPDIIIGKRKKPLCHFNELRRGSQPTDKGWLSRYSEKDKNAICKKYPQAKSLFKPLIGASEFINGKKRYCLWLKDVNPGIWLHVPPIRKAVKEVRAFRSKSHNKGTLKASQAPALFQCIRQPSNNYLLIPRHTSKNRDYIPIGFMSKDVIVNDSCYSLPDATPYMFGVMESHLHTVWVALVSGRYGPSFRYSAKVTYNNFPWPSVSDKQKQAISKTAKAILQARKNHADTSLADMYNPLSMSALPDLLKAQQANDRAVFKAYGLDAHPDKNEITNALLKRYAKLSAKQEK